ncbi:hypothetical protein SEPCBS57363_005110 [Sporothrix epigloea]|uniref:Thioesterase domain-containing protein n=1 Tax=Sporothrix epigloea TaxID=1892477 RepID=A0ABP0DYN0_9PEZI
MVVRIPATALCWASRAVACPCAMPTASASAYSLRPSAADLVIRRRLSSQPTAPQYFPPPPPPPKKPRIQRSTQVFLAIGTVFSTAATMFVLQKPLPFEEMLPRGSKEERLFKELEAGHADAFPIVKTLEASPDWEEWDVGQRWQGVEAKEAAVAGDIPGGELVDVADVSADLTRGHTAPRPSPTTPRNARLTTGALGGAEGLGSYHRIFHNASTGEIISVLRIGRALAGWPGTAHGGALATILDEALGRCAILVFPARTGVTARLELSYRKPVPTGQFYVVKCKPQLPQPPDAGQPQEELRKLWCHASLESMEGEAHVAAKGLFVVPRKYKLARVEDKF